MPKPNLYWRNVRGGRWGEKESTTHGELSVGSDTLLDIVETAKNAGIPQKKWNMISQEKDYTVSRQESMPETRSAATEGNK
jgi:hypothetical protein